MSNVARYLELLDTSKNAAKDVAKETSSRLVSKELTILSLVEELDRYLNNDEAITRARTMSFLADILENIPVKVFSEQQRSVFCQFLLARLADGIDGVAHCSRALLALERLGRWDQETVSSIIEALLAHSSPLSSIRLQSERYAVLLLFDRLFAQNREGEALPDHYLSQLNLSALKSLYDSSPSFLARLIEYFNGEKDPRNLMVVFSILRVPAAEWDLSTHAQDLFETVFNYFPITFRPPPYDPYGITAQQLKDRLEDCISCSDAFAPHAFPALLDKLDSTTYNTKRDTLRTISACVTKYDPSTITNYSLMLWEALKFEIFDSQEEDLGEHATTILKSIAKRLSTGNSPELRTFLKPVVIECTERFQDAPTKKSQAASQITEALLAASPPALAFISETVIPELLTLIQGSEDVAKRRSLMETLLGAVSAAKNLDIHVSSANSTAKVATPFLALKPRFLTFFQLTTRLDQDSELPVVSLALKGLVELTKISGYLDLGEISEVAVHFCDMVSSLRDKNRTSIKRSSMDGLVVIAQENTKLIEQIVIPHLFANIKAEGSATISSIETLSKLADVDTLCNTISTQLLDELLSMLGGSAAAWLTITILTALLYINNQQSIKRDQQRVLMYDLTLRPILKLIFSDKGGVHPLLSDTDFLNCLGKLAISVLQSEPLETHQSVSQQLYRFSETGAVSDVLPFERKPEPIGNAMMHFATHIIAALRRDVSLPIKADSIVKELIIFATDPDVDAGSLAAALSQITLYANKYLSDEETSRLDSDQLHRLDDSSRGNRAEDTYVHITLAFYKGVILRNGASTSAFLQRLLDALPSHRYGLTVAWGFSKILELDEMTVPLNHCIVWPLYRQKLYSSVVPEIIQRFRAMSTVHKTEDMTDDQAIASSEPERTVAKRNYLTALACIVRSIPYTVLEPDLNDLLPIFLQTLDVLDESSIRVVTVKSVISVLVMNPDRIGSHASSFVTRLLSLVSQSATGTSSPALRLIALQCLALMPAQLKQQLLLPLRSSVISKLTAALDDPKRSVRTEAVRCRTHWLELDEVSLDDE